jgi:hypothetical protein
MAPPNDDDADEPNGNDKVVKAGGGNAQKFPVEIKKISHCKNKKHPLNPIPPSQKNTKETENKMPCTPMYSTHRPTNQATIQSSDPRNKMDSEKKKWWEGEGNAQPEYT